MQTEHHCLILPHIGAYMIYNSRMGDQLDGPFPSTVDAWLTARATLRDAGSDPSAVLDLTGAPDDQLREYLR